jgi:hypothetical protein
LPLERNRRRHAAIACSVALACVSILLGLSSCGGVANDDTVVRVGGLAFSKTTVDHWTSVIEHGGAFSGFRGAPRHGTPRQRAITLLISSNWLIDEAAREGVAIPEPVVDEALAERERSAEFRKHLRATGQRVADVKLELRAELAGEAIREKLAGNAAEFSRRDLVAFYHDNGPMFSSLEVRLTDLVENLPSASAAEALVRRIGRGRRFAKLAYHEQVSRTAGFMRTPEKEKVVDAIFAARTDVVSRPMMLNGHWAVFVVRKAVPPKVEPLARVHTEVASRLDVARQREIAARFDREYTERLRAMTSCRAGYVAPGCPQFTSPLGAYEDPFSRRAHPLLSEETAAG